MASSNKRRAEDRDVGRSGDAVDKDWLWKQYETHLDLYKFHVDQTIKVNVVTFAVTGGLLSYIFAKHSEMSEKNPVPSELMIFALFLPVLMSVALCAVMVAATISTRHRKRDVLKLKNKLEVGPILNLDLLQIITVSFAIIHGVIAIGLSVLLLMWSSIV